MIYVTRVRHISIIKRLPLYRLPCRDQEAYIKRAYIRNFFFLHFLCNQTALV